MSILMNKSNKKQWQYFHSLFNHSLQLIVFEVPFLPSLLNRGFTFFIRFYDWHVIHNPLNIMNCDILVRILGGPKMES